MDIENPAATVAAMTCCLFKGVHFSGCGSVVKVIVPGLRHYWAQFAPGRLYDVPVQVGWLNQALKEDKINPIAIFF